VIGRQIACVRHERRQRDTRHPRASYTIFQRITQCQRVCVVLCVDASNWHITRRTTSYCLFPMAKSARQYKNMSTDILFGSKAISNDVVFCRRARSLAMIKVDPIKCHFICFFFCFFLFSLFSFLVLSEERREKRALTLVYSARSRWPRLALGFRVHWAYFLSSNLLRRLTLAVIYSIFRSCQVKSADGTQSNNGLKIDFLEFFSIFIHLHFFLSPCYPVTRSGAWGVFNCFLSLEQIQIKNQKPQKIN